MVDEDLDSVVDSTITTDSTTAITESISPEFDPTLPTEFYHFNLYIPTRNRTKETIEKLLGHIFKFHFTDIDVEVMYVETFNKEKE